jgi:peptidoglycan/LPS O-acetylase OafA/YrhL
VKKGQAMASRPQRNLSLDLLRALAVLLVLGRHAPSPPESATGLAAGFLQVWKCGGWIGVDLFFVLSGFLIAGLLFKDYQKNGRISLRTFYFRRGLKIYPAFWVYLAATTLGFIASGRVLHSRMFLADFFFFQNYVSGMIDHTWSLAVEEHFYILLPLLLIAMVSRSPGASDSFTTLPRLYLVVASVLLLARLLTAMTAEFDCHVHLFPTHLRIDSLLLGVVLGHGYHFHRSWFERHAAAWRYPLLGLGVLLLSPAFLWDLHTTPWIYTAGLTLFSLGSAALLASFLFLPLPRGPLVRGLAALGACSYSIYLWHMPVWYGGTKLVSLVTGREATYPTALLVYLIGSVVVGVGMTWLVEKPVLWLRDRWCPSRSGSPLDQPARGETPPAVGREAIPAAAAC